MRKNYLATFYHLTVLNNQTRAITMYEPMTGYNAACREAETFYPEVKDYRWLERPHISIALVEGHTFVITREVIAQ